MSRGFPFRPVLTGSIAMDAPYDGARMQSVPQREMRIQVSAPGYQKKDVERFTMDKRERKTINVQLMPLEGSAGTVVSPASFDSATIYWFTANGEETEHADVASDGTFVFARKHDSSETMVIVSASHPLWAVKSPVMRLGDTIKLPFPPSSRSFEVITKGPSAFLTVAMGGVRVPLAAFREHQQLRRNPSTTQPGRVLPVNDIAAVGTIDVLLGPAVEMVAPRAAAVDVFTLPQFKIVTRRLEPDQTTVSFVP
jgi:hypothetical protein